jgi:predicted O-methyltransferase YrrM
MNDLALRLQVFRCRRKSDTSSRFLLELGRCVLHAPRGADAPPFLEIGTRAGGSALLVLRLLDAVYPRGQQRPFVLTVDPYGSRPYEGAPFVYDERHYRAMKRTLARFPNHIHYMMDSELFLRELEHLYLWVEGARRPIDRFSLVYLDGSHDPDIVWGEIERLLPRIVPGGFLVVDDTEWFGGEVRRRLEAAAPRLGGKLRHNAKQSIVAVERRPGP